MNRCVYLCSSFMERPLWRPYATRWSFSMSAVLFALTLTAMMTTVAAGSERRVSGAGKTIIEGGTGGTAPMPVTTLVAFHADASGGDFECLAFAPSHPDGTENGELDRNVMYVTGKVTAMVVIDQEATFSGTATVTGLGAGLDVPFTVKVRAGGPGATVTLKVSGLTFAEILVDGHISINRDREE